MFIASFSRVKERCAASFQKALRKFTPKLK
jgi:hypothetical protein